MESEPAWWEWLLGWLDFRRPDFSSRIPRTRLSKSLTHCICSDTGKILSHVSTRQTLHVNGGLLMVD
jgi:hypothetical protein